MYLCVAQRVQQRALSVRSKTGRTLTLLPVIKECPALRRQGSAGRMWLASV